MSLINEKIESLESELRFLRYHTSVHGLHHFEKFSGEKREDIEAVWFDGGHGYTMCTVRTKNKDFYISDEMEAAFILDWARANGKLTAWQKGKLDE